MVRQVKVAEEQRVDLACHDNPKEFFGCVKKHTSRANLGAVFSSDGHDATVSFLFSRECPPVVRAKRDTDLVLRTFCP